MGADLLVDALCDRCWAKEEIFGGPAAEYDFLYLPMHLPLHYLRRHGWQAIPSLPLLCPKCAKEAPMNPVAPSVQALAIEHRAAPLEALSDQILDLELQLEHLRAARADAELATQQRTALEAFLAGLLTEPPLPWAEPDQAASIPEVALQDVQAQAPVEDLPLENTPEPEAQRPVPEPTPGLPAAESAPLESAPEQPTEDSALDTLPPAALPSEPEIPLPSEESAEDETPDEVEENPELEGPVALLRREIVTWLSAHPSAHSAREISAGLEAIDAHGSITKILTLLHREGQIQRRGEGGRNDPYQYFVPTSTKPEQESPTPEPEQTEAPDPEPPPESQVEISQESILAWFQESPGKHTTKAVADAFDMSANSAGITLRLKKLWEQKELRRFGQGINGDPFLYCLPGEVIAAPTATPTPIVTESPRLSAVTPPVPEVPPTINAADLEETLEHLTRSGTLTAKTCATSLKIDQLVAERCLETLCDSGDAQRISLIRTESGARSLGYRVPKPNRQSTDSLTVPPQLTQDEAALFLELRKDFKGKVVRTLLVKIQWNLPRLKKALDGLLHAGHIGQWGTGTSATYAALAPEQ